MAKVQEWLKWLGAIFVAVALGVWQLIAIKRAKDVGEAKAKLDKAREDHKMNMQKYEEEMHDIEEKEKADDAEALKEDALKWARKH